MAGVDADKDTLYTQSCPDQITSMKTRQTRENLDVILKMADDAEVKIGENTYL